MFISVLYAFCEFCTLQLTFPCFVCLFSILKGNVQDVRWGPAPHVRHLWVLSEWRHVHIWGMRWQRPDQPGKCTVHLQGCVKILNSLTLFCLHLHAEMVCFQLYCVNLLDGIYTWRKVNHKSGSPPSPRDKLSCWVFNGRQAFFKKQNNAHGSTALIGNIYKSNLAILLLVVI